MNCPSCQAAIADDVAFCPRCGVDVSANPYASRGMQKPTTTEAPVDPNYGGMIPYKNPKALIAYYLGLFSLLPLIGFFLGIAALTLGIMGLRDRARRPEIKGHVHAGIGIGCGTLTTIGYGIMIVGIFIAILSEA